ncbi:MAG: site-2 protease family protein [Dethiobacter sp.]|jgi:Zn-dependent protease|nr:site-2 protease family protein [Dethiobacter sp.]
MLTNNLLYRIPALLIALTFHEFAHGWVAHRLGDDTAKSHGRLTLNPLAHLDPLGLLAIWLVGFGWAKPVPVNPYYFRGDRRRGMFLVGLAGPLTNFLLAFVIALLLAVVPALYVHSVVREIIITAFWYNALLGVFNLLPVPPLDGSKVFAYLLPRSAAHAFGQIEQYGPMILILLIFTGVLGRILMPMAFAAANIILALAGLLANVF